MPSSHSHTRTFAHSDIHSRSPSLRTRALRGGAPLSLALLFAIGQIAFDWGLLFSRGARRRAARCGCLITHVVLQMATDRQMQPDATTTTEREQLKSSLWRKHLHSASKVRASRFRSHVGVCRYWNTVERAHEKRGGALKRGGGGLRDFQYFNGGSATINVRQRQRQRSLIAMGRERRGGAPLNENNDSPSKSASHGVRRKFSMLTTRTPAFRPDLSSTRVRADDIR